MPGALLYLHGFCSSPASWKARLLAEYYAERGWAERFLCPFLSPVPREAIAAAAQLLEAAPRPLTLVGSSLGGFYAAHLAEKFDLRAVLINPVVPGHLALTHFIGTHRNFHTDEAFEFTKEHAAELSALTPPSIAPGRYLVLLEEGDEVLDWRLAAASYAGSELIALPGGDHSFTRFPAYLEKIVEFAGL